MFHLVGGTLLYKRLGLALWLLQLSVFIFCFPPFHYGRWIQSEPVVLALFLLAVIDCFWLWLGVGKSWLKLYNATHPLWLILLLWVGWQLVATAFALSPWRSWFGIAETGEGTAWYLAMLLCFMLAFPLWQIPLYRRIMLQWAALGMIVLCLFHLVNPNPTDLWSPWSWPHYLAFMLGWTFVAVMASTESKNVLLFGALLVLAAGVLFVSFNHSARFLFPFAFIATWAGVYILPRHFPRLLENIRPWKMLAIAACFLPIGWVVISQQADWFPDKHSALGARAEMNRISLSTLEHEPERLIAGGGWGRYTDDDFKYALVDGVYRFLNGKPALSQENNNSYHSHNQPMEALLSLGIPGLVLWFAFPLLVIWLMPPAFFWRVIPMHVTLTILSYVWFLSPQLLAYQTMYWAALVNLCVPKPNKKESATPRWLLPVFAVLGCVMLWSAREELDAISYGDQLSKAVYAEPYSHYSSDIIAEDIKRGGDRLRTIAMDYGVWLAQHPEHQADDNARGWYLNLMHAADAMAQSPRIAAREASVELWMQNMLMVGINDPMFNGLKRESMQFYPASVMRLAVQAPLREDFAAPYLSYVAVTYEDNPATQIDILGRLLALEPQHRSALWVLGRLLLNTPGQKAVGEDMLRSAVALGVAKVYPVSNADLEPYKPADR